MIARLCLAAMAGLLIAAGAGANEYDDFRIPDHHWRSWTHQFGADWEAEDLGDTWFERRSSDWFGRWEPSIEWARDSDSRQHRLLLRGRLLGLRGVDEDSDRWLFSPIAGEIGTRDEFYRYVRRRLDEYLETRGEWRAYPWPASFGVVASGGVRASYGQSWGSTTSSMHEVTSLVDSLDRRLDDSESWTYAYAMDASLQFGLGRVRDATGIERARLLADRLHADGRLLRELSPAAIQALAGLFYAEPAFDAPHAAPARFFWREIERVLREDGALGESGMDAFDAVHALEWVRVTASFARPAGWFVGPTVAWTNVDQTSRQDSRFHRWVYVADSLIAESSGGGSSRYGSSSVTTLLGARAEWHRPAGRRLQLDLVSTAAFDAKTRNRLASWRSSVRGGYLVGERWFAWVGANHERGRGSQSTYDDYWAVSTDLGVRYYLEDRWSVSATYNQSQSEASYATDDPGRFTRRQFLSLGLTWNGGRLEAPGLMEPVVPLN